MEILKVSWNGWKIRNDDKRSKILGGMYERIKIRKDRWKGWKIKETQG